jgi:hypothetical protein
MKNKDIIFKKYWRCYMKKGIKSMMVLLCVLGLMVYALPITTCAIEGDTEKQLPDGGSGTMYTYIRVYGRTSGGKNGYAEVSCTLRYAESNNYSITGNNLSVNVANASVTQTVSMKYHKSGENTYYTITENPPAKNLGSNLKSLVRVTSPEGYVVTRAYQYNYVSYTNYGTWRSYNQVYTN